MNKYFVLFNGLLASLLLFMLFFWNPESSKPLLDARWSVSTIEGDFSLKKENQHKMLMLYFGYTFCPDICPSTLLEVAQALNNLPPSVFNQMEVLFISLDEGRDQPAYLAQYARFFHPKIKAGLANDLAGLTQALGVVFHRQSQEPFLIDHSADTILIAAGEKEIKRIPYGTKASEFQSAILSFISEKGKE